MPNITTNHAITYTNAPLYAVRIVLQTPISNKPWCLIYVPYENYSKILGISKKEQKHLIHSVSCVMPRGFAYFIILLGVRFKVRKD